MQKKMTTALPFMPPHAEDLVSDSARVEALVPYINRILEARFDRQDRNDVVVSLTPAMPKSKLESEIRLTQYPFGAELNRAQLGMLREVYTGWNIRPMYTSLVKHQLVFSPRDWPAELLGLL